MDEHEVDTSQPFSPAGAFLQIMLGVIFLLLVIVGLIAGWGTFLKAAPILVQILVVLVAIAGPGAVIAKGAKAVYLDIQHARAVHIQVRMDEEQLQAMEDARYRANQQAEAETERIRAEAVRIRAEAEKLLTTIEWDAQGNAARWDPYTRRIIQVQGQMREHPALHALNYRYDYKDASTKVSEEQAKPGQIAAASLSLPKIEHFYAAMPFNSLQVGLGLDAKTGQFILASIEKSTHFKFIGGSNMGKSCVAAAILDIATTMNDADHLRLGLLDLEYNTSRLFEHVPHIAEIGPKRQRLIGRDPDEVAHKLKLLQWELNRRAELGEAHCRQHEPLLLVYVEEMLALKYEVVDEKLKKEMLAAINILGVRGRKYLIYFLACMQTDYSDKSTREAMAQYRTRGGFAIDPDTARASGFFNTELVKQNFQTGRQGQYVLEKPQYSGIVLAPDYDVKSKLLMLTGPTTRATTRPTTVGNGGHDPGSQNRGDRAMGSDVGVSEELPTTIAPQANGAPLSAQERRILKKYREGMSINAIISSEYADGNGKPLTGGRLFTEKAREMQALIARFLPVDYTEEA